MVRKQLQDSFGNSYEEILIKSSSTRCDRRHQRRMQPLQTNESEDLFLSSHSCTYAPDLPLSREALSPSKETGSHLRKFQGILHNPQQVY